MSTVQHVAFIMDGNRRFAKRLMTEPWKGHEYGINKFKEVLGWLRDAGIHEATFYAFSTENFNRPKQEFDFLMDLATKGLLELCDDASVHEHKIKFTFIGELERFPQKLQQSLRALSEQTKNYTQYRVNIALGYGGRQELAVAMRAIAHQIASGILQADAISTDVIAQHLYLQSEPDLIIRTGGEVRTSNFLMWQSAYSEWYFCEKMWPEFSSEDFKKALAAYSERQRRFGR